MYTQPEIIHNGPLKDLFRLGYIYNLIIIINSAIRCTLVHL